jgi:hypothetical protein
LDARPSSPRRAHDAAASASLADAQSDTDTDEKDLSNQVEVCEIRDDDSEDEERAIDFSDVEVEREANAGPVAINSEAELNAWVTNAILNLLIIKQVHHLPDAAVSSILEYVRKTFGPLIPPQYAEKLPESVTKAMPIIQDLLMEVRRISCCPKQCVAFIGEYKHNDYCPKCGDARYDEHRRPRMVFYHLPLIPRLKRLFGLSVSTSCSVRASV